MDRQGDLALSDLAAQAERVLERLDTGIPLSDPGAMATEALAASCDDPVAHFGVAAVLLSVFEPASARPWLERVEQGIGAGDHWLAGRLNYLWSLHDIEMADPHPALEHGRAAVRSLEPGLIAPPLPPGVAESYPWMASVDSTVPLVLPGLLCRGYSWVDDYAAGHDSLAVVAHHSDVAEAFAVQAPLAGLLCREGRLTEAVTAARLALAGAERIMTRLPAAAFGAHQALCLVLCERDLLVEAEVHLEQEMRIVARGPAGGRWRAIALLDEIELRRAAARHADARRLLDDATRIEADEGLPEHLSRRLLRARVLHLLDEGDVQAAAAVLNRSPGSRAPILQARVDLAAGQPDRAAARLRGAVPPAKGGWQAIERLVLLARTELARGDRRRAAGCLSAALEMGRADGFVRTFTAEGADVATLLAGMAGPYPDPYVEGLLARTAAGDRPRAVGGSLPDTLTGREREILRHLTTHFTQQEIAGELYVSVNTLKTHLKSLYRKLGVARRSEAVAVAESLGLFEPAAGTLPGHDGGSERSA